MEAANRNLLYTPEDSNWLSAPLCIVRAQIEIFAATAEDVTARKVHPPTLGRVGMRCIHCAHLPYKRRAKGSVSYPKSIHIMHQAVRNFQRYHFDACDEIPASIKEEYNTSRNKSVQSRNESADYWVKCCERMGMVDAHGDEEGIRFTIIGSDEKDGTEKIRAIVGTPTTFAKKFGASSSSEKLHDINDEKKYSEATEENWGSQPSVASESELSIIDSIAGAANVESLDVYNDLDFDDVFAGNSLDDSEFFGELDFSARSLGEDALLNDIGGPSSTSLHGPSGERTSPLADLPASDENVGQGAATNVEGEQLSGTQDGTSKGDLLESVHLAHELVKGVKEGYGNGVTNGVHSNLKSLGCVIYRLFAGVNPFDGNAESSDGVEAARAALANSSVGVGPKKKRRETQQSNERSCIPLRDLGFPVALCSLVSSLMEAMDSGAADRYNTLEEVENDLYLMAVNPDRYLYDACGEKLSGHLILPEGRLYGRENHTSKLMSAFDRVIGPGGGCEMVLVSGYSGTGKSAFVDEIRKPLTERKGSFISGKFDELGQVQPLAVLVAAFNEYCRELLDGNQDRLAQVRMAIKDALGSNGHVLTDLMPDLSQVIGESESTTVAVEGKNALNRMAYLFKLFVRAIACPSYPVVLFLDDLQWADEAALEFLTMLVTDAQMSSLLFIGAYRNNEVGRDHLLNVAIANIAIADANTLAIELDNIDYESINELISDTLHLLPRLTRSLSDIVHAKTNGNPLFVIQFLRSLFDEHLLVYSASSRRWEWDIEAIQAKDIADNVVDLMKSKMLKLNPHAQDLLKVAACLGSRTEVSTLKLLSEDCAANESATLPYLETIVHEGLMSRVGSYYKFSHDQIRQAAYSLIPVLEQKALHLHIGRTLWERASGEALDKGIFAVVDQLIRGSDLIKDHDEKIKVAELCLVAGKKAMKSSAFLPASIYLLQGTTYLGESDWEHHYDLILQLFTCCAEAQYVTGNFVGVMITSNPIFARGRSLQDKLPAHCTVLNSLGAQGKASETIRHGLNVLQQFGEYFPNEPKKMQTMMEFAKTRIIAWKTSFLDGMSVNRIVEKYEMGDADKIAVMKLLVILTRYAYQENQGLVALIVFRLAQLSLSHGVCRESALGFAAFGAIMCKFGAIEHGYRYGKLALSLLDRFDAKEDVARVYSVLYSSVNIFVEPLQAVLPSLKHGYEVGIRVGDFEWALTCARALSTFGIQCGSKLGPLSEEVKAYVQQMKEYKHHTLTVTLPYLQAILNLLGCPEDPTVLTGDAMDQEELVHRALESQNVNVELVVCFNRMWLAYLFGNIDLAGKMATCIIDKSKSRPIRMHTLVDETFYSGLTAVAMLRRGGLGDEWRNIAEGAVKKLKGWVQNSKWNFQHKLDLLVAELAYLNGDLDKAAKAYNDAIHVAGEHSFIHEQALACERAGIFYSEAFCAVAADIYFKRAQKYYREWGATRKAEDVSQRSLAAATSS